MAPWRMKVAKIMWWLSTGLIAAAFSSPSSMKPIGPLSWPLKTGTDSYRPACGPRRWNKEILLRSRRRYGPPAAGNDLQEESGTPMGVLRQALDTRKVEAKEVTDALRKLANGEYPNASDRSVEGRWELVFSTQLKGGYMPVREIIGFYPTSRKMAVDTNAGPFPLGGIRGTCSWRGGDENALDFSVNNLQFGPLKINRGDGDVKTYRFFVVDDEILAAHSSAGSIALLRRF